MFSEKKQTVHVSTNWKLVIIKTIRRQTITWTNVSLLSIALQGTNFSEIWIRILSWRYCSLAIRIDWLISLIWFGLVWFLFGLIWFDLICWLIECLTIDLWLQCSTKGPKGHGAAGKQQKGSTKQQKANTKQQKANTKQQKAKTRQQNAKTKQQKAKTKQQKANTKQQKAKTKQQKAKTKQQKAKQNSKITAYTY